MWKRFGYNGGNILVPKSSSSYTILESVCYVYINFQCPFDETRQGKYIVNGTSLKCSKFAHVNGASLKCSKLVQTCRVAC